MEFNDIDQVFIEPVPRNDPDVRAAVLKRYGESLEHLRKTRNADI